jgi:hypothetical protein
MAGSAAIALRGNPVLDIAGAGSGHFVRIGD